MVCDPDLPAHNDEIAKLAASRYARLRHKNTVSSRLRVVPNLDQIINLGALAEHRVAERAAVDGRTGADLHVVLDNHTAQLRNLGVPRGAGGEAEARLADLGAGQDVDAVAYECVRHGDVG
jgi:hypothetical protein